MTAQAPGEAAASRGLECRGVHLTRERADGRSYPVLSGVSASFRAGTCALVFGATGSGKSTLLHLLAGFMRPTAGEILADGEPVSRFTAEHRDRWRRAVGFCFQRAELWPELTALESVMMPLVPRGGSLALLRTSSRAALDRVGSAHLEGRMAGELSLGERQRVALARALVSSPRYLLADEPTAHQDDSGAARVARLIAEEAARGVAVVVASHDPRLREVEALTERLFLHDGRLRSGQGDGALEVGQDTANGSTSGELSA